MARKRQHKHARKAVKRQGSIPSKPWGSPSAQTHPAIKISEAILTLAEPLRAHYREPHRLQAIIAIAVMAWNIALFPDEEHAHVQGMLLESLPPQGSGEDVGVLVSTIETLMARKRRLYPQVREYMLTHQLAFVDNHVTLSVGTAPVPEHIQRRSPGSGHAGRDNEGGSVLLWQERLSILVSEQEAKTKPGGAVLPLAGARQGDG